MPVSRNERIEVPYGFAGSTSSRQAILVVIGVQKRRDSGTAALASFQIMKEGRFDFDVGRERRLQYQQQALQHQSRIKMVQDSTDSFESIQIQKPIKKDLLGTDSGMKMG
jgi:hypothetical protein